MSEFEQALSKKDLEEGSKLAPRFDANGLVTAVVSDADSGQLLMVAHMNAEALEKTLETRQTWLWSRSRKELWHKGASSGAVQDVADILTDCDQDTFWLKVRPRKAEDTCHTGRVSCFYRSVNPDSGDLDPVTK